MIKSELGRGLIYTGESLLACDIQLQQTGPMQLTVTAGQYRRADGITFTLNNAQVLDLSADFVAITHCRIELGITTLGDVAVLCRTRLAGHYDPAPEGWRRIHSLTVQGSDGGNWEFQIPAGCTDLTDVDIYTIAVRQGVPG